jgi:hypothetical protein
LAIFNLSNFNFNNVFQAIPQTPIAGIYTNIKLFGNAIFDDLEGTHEIMTQQQIDDLSFTEIREYGVLTFLLAQFNNNLQGGNVTSLPAPIDGWIVLRKEINDAKFTKVDELEAIDLEYIDRLANSNSQYVFQFIPKTGDFLGQPMESNEVLTQFNKIILLDDKSENGYSFCLDLRLSETNIEQDITFNDVRSKFQTALIGEKEVHVGSMGFIANSNSVTELEFEQDFQYMKQFEAFLLNGEEKILKFTNGYMYRVITSNVSLTKKNGNINGNSSVWIINFEWREINEI